MIKAARQSALQNLLQERGVLSTKDLADALGVSVATVRRDLEQLAVKGRIERVFGGARLHPSAAARTPGGAPLADGAAEPARLIRRGADEVVDDPFHEVHGRNLTDKQKLATAAAELIHDGETIFVDVGTTTFEFARTLAGRALTVVTNSIGVVELLGPAPGVELIVLGGDYNPEYRCTQGAEVERALGTLHIDRAVLGCSGISDRGVVRDTDTRHAAVKRMALKVSTDSLVLADSTKLPGMGAYSAFDLAAADALVTDGPLPDQLSAYIADHSLEVINP